VRAALLTCRPALIGVGVFSAVVNVLSLTGSLYMLQVYDRVLASQSIATLIGLSLLALAAYLLQGALEAARGRMLARIGAKFDQALAQPIFSSLGTFALGGVRSGVSTQALRDLEQVRTFLGSLGPTALFDLPWMPLFFACSFLLHPVLGVITVLGGLVIISLTVLSEIRTRGPAKAAVASGAARHTIVETALRNAEVIRAMGMDEALRERFTAANERHVQDGLNATDAASTIGSMAKIFRAILQSTVLAAGAVLAINHEVSAGAMIAASIITARALAPVEMAVAHWRGFTSARQSFSRLEKTLAIVPLSDERLPLRKPQHFLKVTALASAAPGQRQPFVQGVDFELKAGQGLGIIGPSASGKSTLARSLIGVWPLLQGDVRLDGASLDQWDRNALGRHIGYLPQDVELFDGTVAENIARFRRDQDSESILRAAEAASAHEMILRLPDGYDTRIGPGGAGLSGGQRQRIGLARALFGEPFLVVLDEPNSNLDTEGEDALVEALLSVRRRGGIALVVTHRPTALAGVDLVAMMAEGRIVAMGRREEVLQRMIRPTGAANAKAAAGRR
jgi:ATP-binding cassette subfamily C protein